MRIAIVTCDFPPTATTPVGGVASAVHALVTGLLATAPALDIHVVHYLAKHKLESCPYHNSGFSYHPIPGGPITRLSPALEGVPNRIAKFLTKLNPDLVHIQASPLLTHPNNFPTVFTAHGIASIDSRLNGRHFPRLRSALVHLRERAGWSRLSHIIAIAGYVSQKVAPYFRGRVHFVPNAISPIFTKLKQRASLTSNVILQVGSLIPRKNAHGSVSAVHRAVTLGADCELVLAGPLPDPTYYRNLRELAAKLGVSHKVHFVGAQSQEKVVQLMLGAKLLLLPSFQETAPMVIAEANSLGLPAIASPAGGVAEMVVNENSGLLVDPNCPNSIGDALALLVLDNDLTRRFANSAHALSSRYQCEAVAARTTQVYQQVIAAKSEQTPLSLHG